MPMVPTPPPLPPAAQDFLQAIALIMQGEDMDKDAAIELVVRQITEHAHGAD